MKKVLKFIGKSLLAILLLLALFLLAMTVYNQIMLRKNKALYETPLGQLVEVDGHNMSVYTEGEGEHTLVFMSGWEHHLRYWISDASTHVSAIRTG